MSQTSGDTGTQWSLDESDLWGHLNTGKEKKITGRPSRTAVVCKYERCREKRHFNSRRGFEFSWDTYVRSSQQSHLIKHCMA